MVDTGYTPRQSLQTHEVKICTKQCVEYDPIFVKISKTFKMYVTLLL